VTKPKCLYCRKPLRKNTYSNEIKTGDPQPTEMYGKKVIQVVRIKILSYRPGFTRISVWTGEWGSKGDDRFCGLTCGHGWAVDHAPKATGA
jgi:hypothetical protein